MAAQPEKSDRPYPQRTQLLPRAKEDITAERLTQLLQNRYPGVVVENLELLQLFDSHTTKMRLALDYNAAGRAAGLPRQMCLKSNYSKDFASVDIHQLEARFYYFLSEKMSVPVAKCYYADWDEQGSGNGLVLLEDLTERGGFFGLSSQLPGVDGVATALEGLAQLHGDLWNSPLLEQSWLPTSMNTLVDNEQVRMMWSWAEINIAKAEYQAILPKPFRDDLTRLERAYDRLVEWENALSYPYCLNLGDCHQGNTYVLPNGKRLWLDWQLVRKGRPFRDFTYFTIGSLTIDERRASERDLLKHYLQALDASGAQGVPSFDEFFANYQRWVMYGAQAWIANQDFWGQPGLPMTERFFTACEDLDTWKLLLG